MTTIVSSLSTDQIASLTTQQIVILGNSGGGSLMAAYQSQAVDPHVTPLEGMRPAAGLGELPPADGYVASVAVVTNPPLLIPCAATRFMST